MLALKKKKRELKKKKQEALTKPNSMKHQFCPSGVTFKFSGSDQNLWVPKEGESPTITWEPVGYGVYRAPLQR